MRFSLRKLQWFTAMVCIVTAAIWWNFIRSGPIDGLWTTPGLKYCLCDGESFFLFEDGKIYLYEENHPPAQYFGSYQLRPDGCCVLNVLDDPADEVVISPKGRWMTWYSRTDDKTTYFRRLRNRPDLQAVIDNYEISYSTAEYFASTEQD